MVAMAKRDYYHVLGIGRTASEQDIKGAYRKLAKRYHPDRNKDDKEAETKFKEIQEAYDVLGDKQKRRQYDQFGHAGVGTGAGQEAHWRSGPGGVHVHHWNGSPGGIEFDLGDLEGLFGEMGGGGGIFDRFVRSRGGVRGARRQPRRGPGPGQDVEHEVTLDFDQAIHGTTLEVDLSRPQPGGGMRSQTIQVRVPPGVQPGQRVRVQGKGHPGQRGGPPGNMYIVCRILPHPYFKRLGNDIYLDVPITISEACLGAKIEMPTIDGPTVVTIPAGTASGRKLRLKGKGVVDPRTGGRGDHYAVVRIVPPPELDERQHELLDELQSRSGFNPREALDWPGAKT